MPRPPKNPVPRRPGPADERLARASLALQMQQPAEAEKLAESVLKSDRGHAAAATLLGHALLMQGRAADALQHLERAARRSDDPTLATLLAGALAAAGRVEDALARLAAITGRGLAYPPAWHEHIARLSAMGRDDDALAVALRAVELMPQAIELRLDLAAQHLKFNDRKAAKEVLHAARQAAPGRADVLSELARAMLLDGDYAAAADAYRHALALQPDDAMTRSNLAACQLELGNRDAGEASLRAAVNGRPQMMGRAIYALSASSHGRFFLRPSAAANFLRLPKG